MIFLKELLINKIDYSQYVPYPYSEFDSLDESLDYCTFELKHTSINEPFRPCSKVKITISDNQNDRVLWLIVSKDTCKEVVSTNKYNHELTLIEETKLLERIIIGGKTVTQPFVKNYFDNVIPAPYINEERFGAIGYEISVPIDFKTPILINSTIQLPTKLSDFLSYPSIDTLAYHGYIIYPNGNEVEYLSNSPYNINFSSLTLSQEGLYTIHYHLVNSDIYFYISVISSAEDHEKYTIKDIINNLLATCETKLKIPSDKQADPNEIIENPRFQLDSAISEEYSKIISPEFRFSNQMTLWEALSEIGGYTHAIPRLKNGVLYFDKLGDINQSSLNVDNYVLNETSFDIEQYTSGLVANVDNLINYDADGSIVEPRYNYQTLRSEETSAYIEEDQLFIRTQYPIGKIIKVECGVLPDETYVGDITNFVYEQSEYVNLSSYEPSYPNSKAYAIYYTLGEKNIKGLTFKKDALFPVFENYAIQNIIQTKLGKDINWWNNLWNGELLNLQNLMFRVTYQPFISTQLKQIKPYTEDLIYKSDLAYNQNSSAINSQSFGANMKGAIARLGTPEITRTYLFKNINEIPQIGEFVNINDYDYYISNIYLEYYNDFIKAQIGFSKDFNRWSNFVGIKNNIRFYEVYDQQAIDRYVFLEDYCILNKNGVHITSANLGVTSNSVDLFAKMFKNEEIDINSRNVGFVEARTYDKNEEFLHGARLPVNSLGIGNTLYFGFEFVDNFSSGNQIITTNGIRAQSQVSYTDAYGEFEYLMFSMNAGQEDDTSYSTLKNFGDRLPYVGSSIPDNSLINTNRFLIIKKDNAERLKVIYLLHFISEDNKVIIGDALSSINPLTSTEETNIKVYISPKRIYKFQDKLDVSEMTLLGDLTVSVVGGPIIYLTTPKATIEGKAWVVVNTDSNGESRLIFGKNTPINVDDIEQFNLFFMHQTDLFK